MKKIIILLIASSFFLLSCSNIADVKLDNQTNPIVQEDHQHEDESKEISLNSVEKWKVDSNMMIHIRNMENDIYSSSKSEQIDYLSLAKKLQNSIDLLTSDCTMDGQAHDELHRWLMPYIDFVTALSKAKDEKEAEKHFNNIQTSFKTFNQYFQ